MNNASAPAQVKEGDLLAGKYRVERIIGTGGMGLVVAAMHVGLNHMVAVKMMLPSAATEAEAVQRFLREARAAAQLRSDHAARVLDVGTLEGGVPFMVMELLLGSDLDAVLRRVGQLPAAQAADYVRQACEALAEAHGRGIVHRDLKPGNLFLTTDARGREQIKVLDFGISKSTTAEGLADLALTKTSAIMGSPLYMSPEQMRATRNVDARTDIWSLGVTLYQLLVGVVPFFTESPMELGAKVLHEEPVAPEKHRSDVPKSLSAIVLRCLEKDPAKRFQTASELGEALQRSIAEYPMTTSGTRVLVRPHGADDVAALPYSNTAVDHVTTGGRTRPASRRSWWAWAAASGVLVATAFAVRVATRSPAPAPAMLVGDAIRSGSSVGDASALASAPASALASASASALASASASALASASASASRPSAPRRDRPPPRATSHPDAPPSAPTTPAAPSAPPANPLDHL